MERKKTSLMILGVCALVLSVIGVTYAFWELRLSQSDEDKIASSCFNVTFTEDGSAIQLEKAYPIEDTEGKTLTPYKFTITNTCDANASYQINLEALEKYNTNTIIAEDIRLNPEYIRAQLNEVEVSEEEVETEIEKDIVNLDSDNKVDPTINDEEAKSYDAYKLATGYLGPNESKSFALRIWLDGKLTTADEDAMNKTFASKITVITSYILEDKIPPVAELELAVCENTITATGSGTTSGNKSITKYEFKIDNDVGWTSNNSSSTKEFTGLDKGNHTVSVRVTDNKGITSETSKTIEIKDEELVMVPIAGKEIPLTTCGNGLYEVDHNEDINTTLGSEWKTNPEYRFAGQNPNNYVWFNCENGNSGNTCEKWRIIGLVNVKVIKEDGSEGIEQRIKIIRDKPLEGYYSWDHKPSGTGSSDDYMGSNDWTDSQLMTMLNGGYYNASAEAVECWKGRLGYTSSPTTCKFDSEDSSGRGLGATAQGMIAEDIIWNIGGYYDAYNVKTAEMYGYERGTTVYQGENVKRPTEWKKDNTLKGTEYHSIGLMYPSDYGYAVGGESRSCIKDTNLNSYGVCRRKNWLYLGESEWLLTPYSSTSNFVFELYSGLMLSTSTAAYSSAVRPVIYLSPSVQIVNNDNDGSYENPYELECSDCTI